jgi:hypothetical protein
MELSDVTGKTPATPGIDPGTFRLVAQCLNHYATPRPNGYVVRYNYGTRSLVLGICFFWGGGRGARVII